MLGGAAAGGDDVTRRYLVSGAGVVSLEDPDQERHRGGVSVDHLALGRHTVIPQIAEQRSLGSEHGLETPACHRET